MNSAPSERNVHRFNEDVAAFGGYAYTTLGRLSCRLANRRISDAIRQAVDLSQAERIVAVGRGIKGQEHLPVAQKLADALGAELAASRPICDSGWLPMERQIGSSGQTVAPKGEVTGAGQRPKTPTERLGLDLKQRAKAEKCLAEAVYFESRGETKRGQIAVAQVVMNRVFSGFYPNTVCAVVYQNAHRRNACQFTFACDGIPDVVREPDAMERAKKIATLALDGKLWLPEVGKATHYHAHWVRPGWVREMNKMHRLGVHTFYRPRAWGDGAQAPEWGDAEATAESAKKLVEAAKKL